MLANKDLYEEMQKMEAVVEELEKADKKVEAATLKSNILILKLLHSLRTNSVTLMRHNGIQIESKHRPQGSNESKELKK